MEGSVAKASNFFRIYSFFFLPFLVLIHIPNLKYLDYLHSFGRLPVFLKELM